jgi:hypothetical protein
MPNGPAFSFALFRRARVTSLNYLRITCCNRRSGLNRLLDWYKIPHGTALDSGQRNEANIIGLDIVDQATRTALDEEPFLSVRNIAKRTCVSATTVWSRLTNFFDFVVKDPSKRTTQHLQQRSGCQMNSSQSSIGLSTKGGNRSSHLMCYGLIYRQITKCCNCGMGSYPLKGKNTWFTPGKRSLQ